MPLDKTEWENANAALSLIEAIREVLKANPSTAYTEDELLAEIFEEGDTIDGAFPAGRWITAQKCGMVAEILVDRGEAVGRYTAYENTDGNEVRTIYYRSS